MFVNSLILSAQRFENGMREHERTAVLPYIDTSLDGRLPNPEDSILWHDDFLGTRFGTVTSGPFALWWTNVAACSNRTPLGLLVRGVDSNDRTTLMEKRDIENALGLTSFQQLVDDRGLEFAHGGVHWYIGRFSGQMSSLACSPVDPAFFLHHAFIDYIWQQFRSRSQQTEKDEYEQQFSFAHSPDSPMHPFFGFTNKDGVSERYSRFV